MAYTFTTLMHTTTPPQRAPPARDLVTRKFCSSTMCEEKKKRREKQFLFTCKKKRKKLSFSLATLDGLERRHAGALGKVLPELSGLIPLVLIQTKRLCTKGCMRGECKLCV
jgi:hypothetical protein